MPILALSTGSLHNYGLNRVWEFAAEAGFDAVEVMIDGKWDTRQADYLCRLAVANALPIAAFHTPFRPLAGFGEDYPACVRRALALARDVGARTVVAHPELANGTDHGQWLIEQYDELSPAGGPVLAIENLPYVPIIKRTRQQISISGAKYRTHTVEQVARFPAITFDTTHFATAGVDILDAYGALRERTRHVHLSDFRDGKEHRLPGQGDLHLDLFLLALAESAYDGVITVELAPDALDAGDDAAIRAHLRDTVAFCRASLT
jgi:sugar phosphate isomerase/epimerase